ncbi:MAG: VIT1/CCC1 transporter family protein [Rhodobacteraceae bacterium]|nr:VIT1/CCC1 transporter family protein [Paracoccaceae bacterium]
MDGIVTQRLGRIQVHLKQIVFGANDGIVTTFAIVAGFAGASAEGTAQIGGIAVLIFGLANLFADGVSMGLGELLSARSKRDLYQQEQAGTLARIQRDSGKECLTLASVFRARGMPEEDAEKIAGVMIRHPRITAEAILAFETGMSDPQDERPVANGIMTFLAFVIFGAIPLVPYFILPATEQAVLLSSCATLAALFALGILRWTATGDALVRSVFETLLVGCTCAGVAFAVGWLVGS